MKSEKRKDAVSRLILNKIIENIIWLIVISIFFFFLPSVVVKKILNYGWPGCAFLFYIFWTLVIGSYSLSMTGNIFLRAKERLKTTLNPQSKITPEIRQKAILKLLNLQRKKALDSNEDAVNENNLHLNDGKTEIKKTKKGTIAKSSRFIP